MMIYLTTLSNYKATVIYELLHMNGTTWEKNIGFARLKTEFHCQNGELLKNNIVEAIFGSGTAPDQMQTLE